MKVVEDWYVRVTGRGSMLRHHLELGSVVKVVRFQEDPDGNPKTYNVHVPLAYVKDSYVPDEAERESGLVSFWLDPLDVQLFTSLEEAENACV